MISASVLKILCVLYKLNGWTLTAPVGFHSSTNQAFMFKSKPLVILSRLTMANPIFITVISIIRFGWLLLHGGEKDAFILILHLTFALIFLIPSVVQVPLSFKINESIASVNHCIKYATTFTRMYGTKKLERRISYVEIVVKALVSMALVWPIINIAFAYIYLSEKGRMKYIVFAFGYPEGEEPGWLIAAILFFAFISLYRAWIVEFTVLFPILIGLELIILILHQIKPTAKGGLTRRVLRKPAHGLHAYRCVQILMGEATELFKDFILPVTEFLLMFFNVTCNVILISMFHQLGLFTLMFATCSAALLIFQFFFYKAISQTFELSKGFASSWKRNLWRLEGEERRLMGKYIKTCPPIKVKIGSFDFYQKRRLVKTLKKVVMNTRKYLLLFLNY